MVPRTKLLIIGGLVLCIIILLLLCVPRSSSGLSEDKFVEIYVQLSITSEIFSSDTLQLEAEKKRIFEQAGVTQDEIDGFINRLNQKPQEWSRVWKKIVEKLEERRENLR